MCAVLPNIVEFFVLSQRFRHHTFFPTCFSESMYGTSCIAGIYNSYICLLTIYLVLFWACNAGFSRNISPWGDSAHVHSGLDRSWEGSSSYWAPGSRAWSHCVGISSVHYTVRHLCIFQYRKRGRRGPLQIYPNTPGSVGAYTGDHLVLCRSTSPSGKQCLMARKDKLGSNSPEKHYFCLSSPKIF